MRYMSIVQFQRHLSNRTPTAQLFGRLSKQEIVSTGVPQRSILGPMIFSCYINDICSVCKKSKMLLYADDTVMYRNISDKERFLDMHNFKQGIARMQIWCDKPRLRSTHILVIFEII